MLIPIPLITIVLSLAVLAVTFYRPRWTLASLPYISAGLVLAGLLSHSLTEVLCGLVLLLAVPLLIIWKNDPSHPIRATFLPRTFFLLLLFLVVLICVAALVAIAVLDWLFLALALLFMEGLVVFGVRRRQRGGAQETVEFEVLSTIDMALQQQLPLSTALEMAADAYTGTTATTLRRISHWLASGKSLTDAIQNGYPQCPAFAQSAIAAAEPIHQLPQAFLTIRTNLADTHIARSLYKPASFLYPIVLFCICATLAWGLLMFVMPQFKAVMEEMVRSPVLPASTQLLFEITRWIRADEGLTTILVIILIIMGLYPFYHLAGKRRGFPAQPSMVSMIGDQLRWFLPIVHWFERIRSQLRVTEYLHLALRAGTPVNEAIAQTWSLDINHCYRRRLRRWHRYVTAGENLAHSAQRAHLGHALVWAFHQDAQSGATPTILGVLESYYRTHYRHRLQIAKHIVEPCATLVVAGFIGFVAYAFFSPIVQIIQLNADLYP